MSNVAAVWRDGSTRRERSRLSTTGNLVFAMHANNYARQVEAIELQPQILDYISLLFTRRSMQS